jgi:hypothetical protein
VVKVVFSEDEIDTECPIAFTNRFLLILYERRWFAEDILNPVTGRFAAKKS